jgi:hypothetical protein
MKMGVEDATESLSIAEAVRACRGCAHVSEYHPDKINHTLEDLSGSSKSWFVC